jgi:hypothetical protein
MLHNIYRLKKSKTKIGEKMKTIEIKNKETGEVLKTKSGEPLQDNYLEEGDMFVPQIDEPIIKKGKFDSYSIPVSLIDVNQKQYDRVWIRLTEGLANALKKAEEPASQTLYKVIKFENKYGEFLGLEFLDKSSKWQKCGGTIPKTIDDFKEMIK